MNNKEPEAQSESNGSNEGHPESWCNRPETHEEGEEKAGENPELGMPADFHQIPPAQMQVMKDDEEEKSKKQPALPLPPNQWAEKEDGLDAIARNLQKEADREDNAAEEGDQGVEDAKNQLGEDSNNAEEKDEGGLLQDLVGGGGGEKENGVKIVKEGGAYQDFNTMPRGNMEENHANVPPPPLE
ncbi:unnamed protein product [Darwinula stevensoni]|uniref:Uncharacterized protein n=1 Tax=Darwinula stevensoni TaxID=69355 RepID=A0A7R8XDQ8_9CRUS|nr:unnamed protein product [Darwinula stevensoni]CAG0888858.1 unnamed protein product [Darwinula stevensoni]